MKPPQDGSHAEAEPLLSGSGGGQLSAAEQADASKKAGNGWIRVLLAIMAASAWMFVSSLLIILNKYIMVDLGFRCGGSAV